MNAMSEINKYLKASSHKYIPKVIGKKVCCMQLNESDCIMHKVFKKCIGNDMYGVRYDKYNYRCLSSFSPSAACRAL